MSSPQSPAAQAITQQPAPTNTMAVGAEELQSSQKATRLRGGCIPCPVSSAVLQQTNGSYVPGWRILLRHTNSVLFLSRLLMYYAINKYHHI